MTGMGPKLAIAALLAGWPLYAVGGDADDSATPSASCDALAGFEIPPAAIALPTGGATVTSSGLVPETDANRIGEYCLVDGQIPSVAPSAQPIKFQVALPTRWNRKVLQLGDGGFRGTVTSPIANTGGTTMSPAPLTRGYIVFGSDSGHSGNALDASFALDAEQLRNFAGEHIKKTADAIRAIIGRYYGQPTKYSYYLGASSGGREAVTAIRDYPDDYQGAIAIMPSLGSTRMALKMHLVMRAMRLDDGAGRIDGQKAEFLHRRVLEQCDGLDGLEDGIVSAPASCEFDFGQYRCAGGADTGTDCFSDAQVATLETMHSPNALDYVFPGGLNSLPAYTIGTDWNSPMLNLAGAAPGSAPGPMANFPFLGLYRLIPANTLKFMVARNTGFDVLGFDPLKPGSLQPRLWEVAGILDRVDADIGRFLDDGGKLILAHGRSDEIVPEEDTVRFYRSLVSRQGQRTVDQGAALYLVPGFAHGRGTAFTARMPLLSALEGWVEEGTAPGTLVATDANAGARERTRPLCRFPAWPKYTGSGDPDRASSFRCVSH